MGAASHREGWRRPDPGVRVVSGAHDEPAAFL
jgi:hypothetical protein